MGRVQATRRVWAQIAQGMRRYAKNNPRVASAATFVGSAVAFDVALEILDGTGSDDPTGPNFDASATRILFAGPPRTSSLHSVWTAMATSYIALVFAPFSEDAFRSMKTVMLSLDPADRPLAAGLASPPVHAAFGVTAALSGAIGVEPAAAAAEDAASTGAGAFDSEQE